jgi:hypothetical protein
LYTKIQKAHPTGAPFFYLFFFLDISANFSALVSLLISASLLRALPNVFAFSEYFKTTGRRILV